ncbi:hypothetical protein BDN67DRAFT_971170 [Paxillus ammoniavirescens]|nr:hypothetical protein BDN67DRAFT_971170 [Paxillus ammoniavirescens]
MVQILRGGYCRQTISGMHDAWGKRHVYTAFVLAVARWNAHPAFLVTFAASSVILVYVGMNHATEKHRHVKKQAYQSARSNPTGTTPPIRVAILSSSRSSCSRRSLRYPCLAFVIAFVHRLYNRHCTSSYPNDKKRRLSDRSRCH